MADQRKTYAELVATDTVADSDLLATFPGAGPLKQIRADEVRPYMAATSLSKEASLTDIASPRIGRIELMGSQVAYFADIDGFDPTGVNADTDAVIALIAQAATAGAPVQGIGEKIACTKPIPVPAGAYLNGTNSGGVDGSNRQLATSFMIHHTGKAFVGDGTLNDVPTVLSDFNVIRDAPPTPTPGWVAPTDDWDLYFADESDLLVRRVFHPQSNKGLFFSGGRLRNYDHWGQFFRNGTEVDYAIDIVHFDGWHYWPFWSVNLTSPQQEIVKRFMQDNCDSHLLRRVDNPIYANGHSIYHRRAFNVSNNPSSDPNRGGTTSKLRAYSVQADACRQIVYASVDAVNLGGGGWTGSFSQCNIQGPDQRDAVWESTQAHFENNAPNSRMDVDLSSEIAARSVVVTTGSDSVVRLRISATDFNLAGAGFQALNAAGINSRIDVEPNSYWKNGGFGSVLATAPGEAGGGVGQVRGVPLSTSNAPGTLVSVASSGGALPSDVALIVTYTQASLGGMSGVIDVSFPTGKGTATGVLLVTMPYVATGIGGSADGSEYNMQNIPARGTIQPGSRVMNIVLDRVVAGVLVSDISGLTAGSKIRLTFEYGSAA